MPAGFLSHLQSAIFNLQSIYVILESMERGLHNDNCTNSILNSIGIIFCVFRDVVYKL